MLAGDQLHLAVGSWGLGFDAPGDFPSNAKDIFPADGLDRFPVGEGLVDHDLEDPLAVAQIDEGQASQLAHAVDPAEHLISRPTSSSATEPQKVSRFKNFFSAMAQFLLEDFDLFLGRHVLD